MKLALVLSLVLSVALACSRAPFDAEELALLESLQLRPGGALAESRGNPYAEDPEAAELGRQLFFDPRLSANGKVACATCHAPERSFTDGRRRAHGLDEVPRNTPTLLGAAHLPFLGWEGKKDSLWAQSLAPLFHPREHGLDKGLLAELMRAHHRDGYERVFGPLDNDEEDDIVARHTAFALAAYVRTLEPVPGPFDRYVAALQEGDARGGGHLSASAVRGLKAFLGPGQCIHCHHGPRFTDGGFHNVGLPVDDDQDGGEGRAMGARALLEDPARCGGPLSLERSCPELRFLDPSFEDFLGAFKTPTLRDLSRTAPYMHGGQLDTLSAVVTFYRQPPAPAAVGHRDLLLDRVDKDLDTDDMVAFLESLTGDDDG